MLPSDSVTRQIFGNIDGTSKAIFYVLAVLALGICLYGLRQRARLWSIGKGSLKPKNFRVAAKRLVQRVLLQRTVGGRGAASVAHALMFSGMVLLALGSFLVAIEHYGQDLLGVPATQPLFHKGLYFAIFEVVTDAAGLALLAGAGWFLWRRKRGGSSIGHAPFDTTILVSLIAMGISGYCIEGLRIIHATSDAPGVSFVGFCFAQVFGAMGLEQGNVGDAHFLLWWAHSMGALIGIAVFPYTRLLHMVAGAWSVATQDQPLGFIESVSMEEVEDTGRFGAGRIQDFSRRQLLELDACVSCGRCQDACPAFAASKPLSPRDVVQAARQELNILGPLILGGADPQSTLHGDRIGAETLLSCTTCHACAEVCPLGVSPVSLIIDMRRHLIGEGELRGAPAQALQRTQRRGNPWGLPPEDRLLWSDGLGVLTPHENPDFDVLYWVGCAAAYDPRAQSIARATVQLLQHAGVNFAVLGSEERCTGETARRMGDEFVFQELAQQNIEVMAAHRVKKIITHCPHCLNSLNQDYPSQGGAFEVVHHTTFLEQLVAAGRLPVEPKSAGTGPFGKVTYHDPCYLARVEGETSAPRSLLQTALGTGSELVEPENHGCKTKCCGAGGGRMWFDDPPEERIGSDRMEELIATGADTIAVGCPFCLRMVSDGVAGGEKQVKVLDVAEILLDSMPGPASTTTNASNIQDKS